MPFLSGRAEAGHPVRPTVTAKMAEGGPRWLAHRGRGQPGSWQWGAYCELDREPARSRTSTGRERKAGGLGAINRPL